MKEWWINLGLREKQGLALGALVIILFLIYEIIWSPLVSHNNFLRHHISHDRTLLTWMQTADQRITGMEKMLQKTTSTKTSAALLSLLQKEITQAKLSSYVTQLSQAENNSVQINFQKINFDNLIAWLTQIWQTHGLTVQQITVNPNGALGIVDVTLYIH